MADTSKLALKNFREIYSSLAAVTGVDPTSADITAYYQQVVGHLPDRKLFPSSMLKRCWRPRDSEASFAIMRSRRRLRLEYPRQVRTLESILPKGRRLSPPPSGRS